MNKCTLWTWLWHHCTVPPRSWSVGCQAPAAVHYLMSYLTAAMMVSGRSWDLLLFLIKVRHCALYLWPVYVRSRFSFHFWLVLKFMFCLGKTQSFILFVVVEIETYWDWQCPVALPSFTLDQALCSCLYPSTGVVWGIDSNNKQINTPTSLWHIHNSHIKHPSLTPREDRLVLWNWG